MMLNVLSCTHLPSLYSWEEWLTYLLSIFKVDCLLFLLNFRFIYVTLYTHCLWYMWFVNNFSQATDYAKVSENHTYSPFSKSSNTIFLIFIFSILSNFTVINCDFFLSSLWSLLVHDFACFFLLYFFSLLQLFFLCLPHPFQLNIN